MLEGLTLSLYQRGRSLLATEQTAAQQTLYRIARVMAAFHEHHDLWLTPTLASPPVALGTIDIDERDVDRAFAPLIEYVPFTALQNGTGQPAINLPVHWNKDNLPIGVQFVARVGDELTLLKLAAEIEKAAPWAGRYTKIKIPA